MKTKISKIDINADVGEGIGNDMQIMPYISSCSIACGGHAGTEASMRETIQLATEHNVNLGPHPSFPDRDNFGRKVLTMTKKELTASVYKQLMRFYAICTEAQVPVHHIKLHGALYNYAAKDAPTADAVVAAIVATKVRPLLYVPFNSVLHKKAENLMPLAFEAFIDRRYNDDGSLVARTESNAVIHDKELAWNQLFTMVKNNKVSTVSGGSINMKADTFCIHGDNTNAVEILKFIQHQFGKHEYTLAK